MNFTPLGPLNDELLSRIDSSIHRVGTFSTGFDVNDLFERNPYVTSTERVAYTMQHAGVTLQFALDEIHRLHRLASEFEDLAISYASTTDYLSRRLDGINSVLLDMTFGDAPELIATCEAEATDFLQQESEFVLGPVS
jgi:hypothetical protein